MPEQLASTPTESMPFKGNVLVVNAHPDDEVMANGELISRLTTESPARVFVLTASLGEASTLGDQVLAQTGGRLPEAEAAYDALGVLPDNRFYPKLPDAKLHELDNIKKLAGVIISVIQENDVTDVVTPGPGGFDGHSDHIAVHESATLAASQLGSGGVHVWATSTEEVGDFSLDVDSARKRTAMLAHQSQFPDELALNDAIDGNGGYQTLMKRETYQQHEVPNDYQPPAIKPHISAG